MALRRTGKVGVYGPKTRALQRRLSFEVYGLTFKVANVFLYLGSRASATPSIDDIQSKALFEVPDRAYATVGIPIPIGVPILPETKTDFSRFGLINPLQDETIFRFHIDDFEPLGRQMVVGDVFELPFYANNGDALWEVTDVDLRSEAEKFICIVNATPMASSRATREITTDRSNSDFMDNLAVGMEEEFSQVVPVQGAYVVDPDVIVIPEPVDYRDPLQRSFLDDPTKEIV